MSKQKPLTGLLCFADFLLIESVNGDDNDLYFSQARCLLQGFELVEGDFRQPIILLLGVCHSGYSLPVGKYTIAVLPNCLTSTALSSWLLATTSSKRGNVTLLFRLMDTSLYPSMVVITLLLIWLLVMVSTIACAFILSLRLFDYLTLITLYSILLYMYTPQIVGGEGVIETNRSRFAAYTLPRYTTAHSTAEGVLCRHESKTCLGSRFSHQSQQPLPGGQPGSNIIGGYGRKIVSPLFVASSTRITPLFELGNNKLMQLAISSIQSFYFDTNKCAKMSDRFSKIEYNYGS